MAIYIIDFECKGEAYHTTGEMPFPTVEAYYSGTYSRKVTDEIAMAFINGYLDVKGLLGEVKPYNIRYRIEFPSIEDK